MTCNGATYFSNNLLAEWQKTPTQTGRGDNHIPTYSEQQMWSVSLDDPVLKHGVGKYRYPGFSLLHCTFRR